MRNADSREVIPARPRRRAVAARRLPPGRRRTATWYALFATCAIAVGMLSGQPVQRSWGLLAAGGYAAAAIAATLWRSRGRDAALLIGLAGGLVIPLSWQVTLGRGMSRVGEGALGVVARSGVLLVRHGTPYLPAAQLTHPLAYDPYLPAMAVFGLPGAAGMRGAAGNPRLWFAVVGVLLLALAFRITSHDGVLRLTAFAASSPGVALQLAVGGTDVPVLALLCVALAYAERRRQAAAAGLAVGVACAIKATAWPALPVLTAMLGARDGLRAAARFAATSAAAAAVLTAATAPAALAHPAALLANTVLFPLGLTRVKTPAASPLPGHLLAALGPAGQRAAIALLICAGLAVTASLVIRPPATARAAAHRLALGLAVMFTLGPASRWGYFIYPLALLGWLGLGDNAQQRSPAAAEMSPLEPAQTGTAGGGERQRAWRSGGWRSAAAAILTPSKP